MEKKFGSNYYVDYKLWSPDGRGDFTFKAIDDEFYKRYIADEQVEEFFYDPRVDGNLVHIDDALYKSEYDVNTHKVYFSLVGYIKMCLYDSDNKPCTPYVTEIMDIDEDGIVSVRDQVRTDNVTFNIYSSFKKGNGKLLGEGVGYAYNAIQEGFVNITNLSLESYYSLIKSVEEKIQTEFTNRLLRHETNNAKTLNLYKKKGNDLK